jgi:hypothetical protein
MLDFAVQRRYHEPRRLTNAALDRMCVCASQKSLFAGKHSHRKQERGALAPRGNYYRECNGDPHIHRRRFGEQSRLYLRKRVSHSHGGLTPAAPVNVRSSVAERCSILRCSVVITNHGG